jgi:hypothetical protein
MKKIAGLVAGLILIGVTGVWAAGRYDIKSGIVTLDSVITMGQTQIKTQKKVYFDEYGLKECQETYVNGKLSGVLLGDGKDKIALLLKAKKAARQGSGQYGIGTRVDLNDLGTKQDLAAGTVKPGAPLTLDGQTCEVVLVVKNGHTTVYGGWHKVLVYLKTGGQGMSTEIKAVKLEANAPVPPEKFQVPAGFTWQ